MEFEIYSTENNTTYIGNNLLSHIKVYDGEDISNSVLISVLQPSKIIVFEDGEHKLKYLNSYIFICEIQYFNGTNLVLTENTLDKLKDKIVKEVCITKLVDADKLKFTNSIYTIGKRKEYVNIGLVKL